MQDPKAKEKTTPLGEEEWKLSRLLEFSTIHKRLGSAFAVGGSICRGMREKGRDCEERGIRVWSDFGETNSIGICVLNVMGESGLYIRRRLLKVKGKKKRVIFGKAGRFDCELLN